MKLRHKKGFTIIELVIVIAVIGILTAVLVPTFINLTNKANEAADDSLVKNLNTALKMEEQLVGNKKNETLQDAIDDLKDEGYLLENLVSKSGKDLLWNQEKNEFVLNNDAELKGANYWQIVDKLPDNQRFSYYAGQHFNDAEADPKYGFDAGEQSGITSVNYTRTGVEQGQGVNIRTNSAYTTLTINAPLDTVKHFGDLGKLQLTDIAFDCYYEHGDTAYVQATKGKIVAKDGGNIGVLYATVAQVAAATDGGQINNAYCVSTSEAEAQSSGYTNFSNSKDGNVTFQYVDKDGNPLTSEDIEETASESQDNFIIEEVEESGLYEARIGKIGYSTFVEATSSVLAGETLVLLKDIVRDETVSVALWDKPFNVDLNGHTYETKSAVDITLGNNGYKASGFCYAYDGNYQVTVKNGTIKTKYGASVYAASNTVVLENVTLYQDHNNFVQSTEEYSCAVRSTGGSAIINSGTFEGHYALVASNTGGVYTINGGTFNAPLFFSVNTNKGVTKSFEINGGTFNHFEIVNPTKGTTIIRGGTFDADPSAYVAEGYHATHEGNVWVVSANS